MSEAVTVDDGQDGVTGVAEPAAPAITETYVLCELAGATYGIASREIAHLEMVGKVTPVPNAPAFVEGVVSTRGQVIPVLNLRARFGFAKIPADLQARIVVVRSGSRSVGLLVDAAREFASIAVDSIRPPPDDIAQISGDYLEGLAEVGQRLVLILRTKQLLEIEVETDTTTLTSAASEG